MDIATKKYTLPELKVGMQVRKSQLSEIMNVYIVHHFTTFINDSPFAGQGISGFL